MPDAESGVTSSQTTPNFVGSMQNFVHGYQNFFELARTGDHHNIELNADVIQNTATLSHPVTFHAPAAFLVLNHYWKKHFSISFQLRTTASSGLILYSSSTSRPIGDFAAVELHQGKLRFVIDVGNGPVSKEAGHVAINDNTWHTVTIGRINNEQIKVQIDRISRNLVMSNVRSVNLDVDTNLFVGGLPEALFDSLPSKIHSRVGFQGCLASLELQHEDKNVFDETTIQDEFKELITQGCQGT